MAATPPVKGRGFSMKEMIAEAKKEGHINTIALPPDWANYGEVLKTFQSKYGLSYTDDNPDGSSAQENQAIVSLKGDSRAPDVVDVGPAFAVSGAAQGLYGRYFVTDRVPVYVGSPYGSFAFGLSGIQPNLPAGWSGGDQLAIHG